MVRGCLYVSVLVLVAPFGAVGHTPSGHDQEHSAAKSARGAPAMAKRIQRTPNFRVSYSSEVMPIPLNTSHSWSLRVKTPQGRPVTGATIKVSGDMPARGRRLPTKHQVTREIADGVYLIEGMKFSTPGQWIVEFDIAANGKKDIAAFSLVLK